MAGLRFIVVAGGVLAAALITGRAGAMGAIVTSPPGASSTNDVRVVVASTGARTSRWVSLHVHGGATAFAWIVPVKPSAFVDLASDAWLESLEDATAPRVVPPDVSPPCGAGGVELDGDPSHVVTTAPDAVATASDAASLATTLSGWGLAMTSDLAPLVDTAGADGDSFVALLYSNPAPDVVTRTVRVVDTSPFNIPLALTSGSVTVSVTAYVFSTGSITMGTAASVALDPSLLLWQADGTSTYAPVSETLLTTNPGAWLVETAGHPELFEGEPVPSAGPVPALAPTYFSRAWTYGDASGAPQSCSAAAAAVATSLSPVAIACPAGALTKVGDAACVEAPTDGEVSPDDLRCGATSDDLAIALSGTAPANAWLTRSRSVLSPGMFGTDTGLSTDSDAGAPAAATGPVVTCSGYAESCGGGSGGGTPTPPGGGATSSSGGNTASSSGGNTDPGGGVASTVGDVVSAAVDSSSDDGCGGDSSEDSGDSCSGSGGGGDDVGGGGCDGDPSTDCSVARPRGRHAPTSRILLLFVALAAVTRRRGRPPVGLPRS
ncbi:MAG: DUF2330 domain-containing protein [Polyangiaceae bacterium]